jgi:hypothetical protein
VETTLAGAAAVSVHESGNRAARYELLRSLGYFVTGTLQVGVGLGLAGTFDSAPASVLEGQLNYHLTPAGTVVPYVGLHGGLMAQILQAHPEATDHVGVQAGMKFFVADRMSVNVEARYFSSANAFDEGFAALFLGVSFFRGGRVPDRQP